MRCSTAPRLQLAKSWPVCSRNMALIEINASSASTLASPVDSCTSIPAEGCGKAELRTRSQRSTSTALGEGLQGRVRLSVPSGYGQLVMADWLIDFKRQYSGIVLDVVFENRIEDLLRDEIDIAVRVIPEPPQNLVARELGMVRYVACATREYAQLHTLPTELDQLHNAPVITAAVVGQQLRVSAYRGETRRELVLEPTLISENFLFLRQAILAGIGIGLVPDYVVADDVERGDVVTMLDDWRLSIFGTKLFMVYMPNRQHTRAIRTFIDFVLERASSAKQSLENKLPEPHAR